MRKLKILLTTTIILLLSNIAYAKSYSKIIVCQMDPGRNLLNCSGSVQFGSMSLKSAAEQGWEVKAVYVDSFQGLNIPTYVFQK